MMQQLSVNDGRRLTQRVPLLATMSFLKCVPFPRRLSPSMQKTEAGRCSLGIQ